MPENSSARIVIVGAGHGGGNAVSFLRQFGHTGPITLIGEEAIVPYQRPPLSKAFLKGETDAESLKLKPDSFYHERHVTLRLGAKVTAIDRAAKRVLIEGGGSEAYDFLILATGSRARKLNIPGADLQGILELRHIEDARRIKAALQPGHRLAVIGGGYIGLEAAASARKLGAAATIVERESRVLARVAAPPLANFFEKYHRAHGVEILVGVNVEAFEERHGLVGAVLLADGRRIECDAALVGIGAMACEELARDAGLTCQNGVVVDTEAKTSDPAVYAIGDMSSRPMPLYNNRMFRLESVPNAIEQARRAVNDILGLKQPAHEVPWFWSDQYDLKLQIAGVPFEADDIVIRGSTDEAKFAIFHLAGDRLLAVEAVNMPKEFMGGRAILANPANKVSRAALADPNVPMKEVGA
jgi:3-phenylpropionate/trans-cinnamate dioxygenase ferredoxin reductase component